MKRLLAARMVLPTLLVASLAGCSSDGGIRARVDAALQRLDGAVAQLGEELDGNRLRNAQLIKQYAAKVATQKTGPARPDAGSGSGGHPRGHALPRPGVALEGGPGVGAAGRRGPDRLQRARG